MFQGAKGAPTAPPSPDLMSFVAKQTSTFVRCAVLLNAVHMSFTSIKTAYGDDSFTLVDTLFATAPAFAHLVATVILHAWPHQQEACLLALMTFRLVYGATLTAGFFNTNAWVDRVVLLHLDKIAEVGMGLLEPVRLSFMVTLRTFLAVSYCMCYSKLGMPYPWLQGILVHSIGLLVGVMANMHYRRLYKLHLAQLQQAHAPDMPSHHKAALPAASGVLEGGRAISKSQLLSLQDSGSKIASRHRAKLEVSEKFMASYKKKLANRQRVAIILHGSATPDMLPDGALTSLKHKLEERLPGIAPRNMTIRAGCVVVCFDVNNMEAEGQPQDGYTQDMQTLVAQVVKEWSKEWDLRSMVWDAEAPDMSVQVSNDSQPMMLCYDPLQADDQQFRSCKITMLNPILIMPTEVVKQQQQQQQQQSLSSPPSATEAVATFEVPVLADVSAPACLGVVRGWQSSADNPEECKDKGSSLWLLGAVCGTYCPLKIQHVDDTRVQLSIELPAEIVSTATVGTVVFELWAEGKLVRSAMAVLLPASCTQVMEELEALKQAIPAPEAASFVEDFVAWLHLGSYFREAHYRADSYEGQHLVATGSELLQYSLHLGLVGVGRLLLLELTSPPSSIPFDDLASEMLSSWQQGPASRSPRASDSHGAAVTELVAAAQQSGSAAVAEQCRIWQGRLGGSISGTALSAAGQKGAQLTRNWLLRSVCSMVLWPWAAAQASNSRSSSVQAAPADIMDDEQRYRVWLNMQYTRVTKAYFLFSVGHLIVLLLRAAIIDQPQMNPALVLLFFYTSAALAVCRCPQESEASTIFMCIGRFITLLGMGSGLLPVPSSNDAVLRFRTEAVLEVFFGGTIEILRIGWLFPLRIALFIGYSSFYQRVGFANPWGQSLLMNGSSFMVSLLLERRNRSICTKHRATADGAKIECGTGHKQHAGPESKACSKCRTL